MPTSNEVQANAYKTEVPYTEFSARRSLQLCCLGKQSEVTPIFLILTANAMIASVCMLCELPLAEKAIKVLRGLGVTPPPAPRGGLESVRFWRDVKMQAKMSGDAELSSVLKTKQMWERYFALSWLALIVLPVVIGLTKVLYHTVVSMDV